MPPISYIIVMASYSAFEYWLGKSDRIKFNSSLEAALAAARAAGAIVFRRRK